MKSKVISIIRRDFESELNQTLEKLKDNEIIDIKFAQGTGNHDAVILSALILYK